MRLQVIAAAAALVIAAGAARADRRAATFVYVYSDDDGLTIISPQLAMRADAGDEVELSATYDVDIISAASVDVVTMASPRGYEEDRHGIAAGLTWRPRPGDTLQLRYLPSWEPDYRSHGVAAGAEREWLDRRLATRLDLNVAFDAVGRSGDDPSRWRALTTTAVRLGAGWVFDRYTVGDVSYELQWLDGFQASPYRFVAIGWSDGSSTAVPEAAPSTRVRHAAAVGGRRALTRSWFLSATARGYLDSWGIYSLTGETELQRAFGGDRFIAGVYARGYWQSAAEFYRAHYHAAPGTIPAFRVSDKVLAESSSVLLGVHGDGLVGDVPWLGAVRASAGVDVYEQHFTDFPWLDQRRAVNLWLGLAAEH